MSRGVHSYGSRPALSERWDVDKKIQTITNMGYFATSVAYLKRLNQKIILHTDSLGKEGFGHIPYDAIYTTLDEIPAGTHPSVGACGKMYAMKREPLDSIHIDGDVFVKTQECVDECINFTESLLVQNTEKSINNMYENNIDIIKHLNFPKHTSKTMELAYNTGIFAFKDYEFKNMFLNSYFDMAKKISKDKTCREMLYANSSLSPDIIIEQKFIYDMSKELDIPVKKLIENNNPGYQHVIGSGKYSQLSLCKRVLKKLNPELYQACELKESELNNKIK